MNNVTNIRPSAAPEPYVVIDGNFIDLRVTKAVSKVFNVPPHEAKNNTPFKIECYLEGLTTSVVLWFRNYEEANTAHRGLIAALKAHITYHLFLKG